MNILKKIPVVAAITAIGAIMYTWGNIDGRDGRTVINRAEAAISPLVSPTTGKAARCLFSEYRGLGIG